MARRKSLRSQLYRRGSDLGNSEAAERGPASYGSRVARREGLPDDQRGHFSVASGIAGRRLFLGRRSPDPCRSVASACSICQRRSSRWQR